MVDQIGNSVCLCLFVFTDLQAAVILDFDEHIVFVWRSIDVYFPPEAIENHFE